MLDLKTLLASYDLAFLRDVAELWGIELHASERRTALAELAGEMNTQPLFDEITAALPQSAAVALEDLSAHGGKLPWQAFEHAYGELRPMGPARRKREKPHRFPENTTERLWYLGLVGRGTLRSQDELTEVAFIPVEFLSWLPEPTQKNAGSLAFPQLLAWSASKVTAQPAQRDQILDDICTLFAALRLELTAQLPNLSKKNEAYWQRLSALVKALSLLDEAGQPNENARVLLEKPRDEALKWLVQGWALNPDFDELRLVPQIRCEGNWQHSAIKPRQAVIDLLGSLPADTWYKTEDLVDFFRQNQPDFLRSGTEYNTWIISSNGSAPRLLHGFEHWNDVEGQYIRFLISEILPVFGLVRVGSLAEDSSCSLFQLTPWFFSVLRQNQNPELAEEDQPVVVGRDGKLEMTRLVPRIARYQLSRFAIWLEIQPERFVYQLTPASLQEAAGQGLELKHLRALLRKYGKPGIPPALQKALSRWESHGLEARIESLVVLRLAEPELLQTLRESKASSCLGEALGPTAVLVKPGCEGRVKAALREIGILTDLPGGDE